MAVVYFPVVNNESRKIDIEEATHSNRLPLV
jgi:hypothetical protein